jgi:hypothetical protein
MSRGGGKTVGMRDIDEITKLIEVYPTRFRRWCDGPERGGCGCTGCVRWPAPATVQGDPEGKPFPKPADRLTKEEVEAYTQKQDFVARLLGYPEDFDPVE